MIFRRSKSLSLTKTGCRQDFHYTGRSLLNPATACSGVIARPTARAEIKVFSPNVPRTATIASLSKLLSKGERGVPIPSRSCSAQPQNRAAHIFSCEPSPGNVSPAITLASPSRLMAMLNLLSDALATVRLSSYRFRASLRLPCLVATFARKERDVVVACCWQVILAKSEETELAEAVRYAFLVSHFIEERIAFLKKWPYLSGISRQEVCSGYIR